ncbi:MAG: SDR family oxidoreductase [Chloroflexi bacterium]|nr:SDR family oxidoreductase [Chloroflexota bacterium]
MAEQQSKKMDGMVAIVTGASRGLGRAIANAFAAEGAKVVVSARRKSPTGLSGTAVETAEQIRSKGGEAMALTCDVTEEKQVMAMVGRTLDRYGRIDVLVNNAGVMVLGETLLDIAPEQWDQSVAANLRGPYLCCRAVLPTMIEQKRGSIIHIGSRMGSDHEQGGGVLYSATKAAVHMFSLCLADEVREHNIAVNILSPGSLRTEGSAAIPWTQRDWDQRVEPEAVGPSAVYLALQDASTFTGRLVHRVEFGETWGV